MTRNSSLAWRHPPCSENIVDMETERSPPGIPENTTHREGKIQRTRKPGISRRSTLALMGTGAVTFATPWVARAQAKTIKVGMPTILSGRVAQLGTSSRNAVMLEADK